MSEVVHSVGGWLEGGWRVAGLILVGQSVGVVSVYVPADAGWGYAKIASPRYRRPYVDVRMIDRSRSR